MTADPIAVIGAGSIGAGWALVFAAAGRAVRLKGALGGKGNANA